LELWSKVSRLYNAFLKPFGEPVFSCLAARNVSPHDESGAGTGKRAAEQALVLDACCATP
jgi:hypothetical protein